PSRPRHITAEQLKRWINEIPAGIWNVGVFVDEPPEGIERILNEVELDIAQLHGAETLDRHPHGLRVWKAFRVRDTQAAVPDYPDAEAILIDGVAYDWPRTAHFTRPLILAGGLDERNVRARIERAKPWAVDVASGI